MTQDNTKKKRHQHRDDLIGEHAAGDAGQMVLAILFTAIWILDSFFLKYTIFLNHLCTAWHQNTYWSYFINPVGLFGKNRSVYCVR